MRKKLGAIFLCLCVCSNIVACSDDVYDDVYSEDSDIYNEFDEDDYDEFEEDDYDEFEEDDYDEENDESTITDVDNAVVQVRGSDMYGNILGDEFYFHRNLLNDVEKMAYDQLYIGMSQCIEMIDLQEPITLEQLNRVRDAVLNDHPEILWFSVKFEFFSNEEGLAFRVKETYNDLAGDRSQIYADFYVQALAICKNAAQYSSKADQAKYVHDYLCYINTYNLDASYNQIAYSSIKGGETVCAGYARGFQYCMQLLGIPTTVVYGYAGEDHSWNLIQLDGEYYNIDVTWDDCYPNPGEYCYDYFNITDEQIYADHERKKDSIYLPEANGTQYNYYNSFFNGNAYGSDFSTFQNINDVYVTFLGNLVANVVNGTADCVDNTDPTLN